MPLPPFASGRALAVPIEQTGGGDESLAFAEVRKDGGDDPDATHGMLIRADIFAGGKPGVEIDGGKGIGRVTLPGLAIAPGRAAINPVPRAQIWEGLRRICGTPPPLRILISAPEGEERARKTMNARLGIVGGISILGTQGIVRPYSNAAWLGGLAEAFSVARAAGIARLCLATGRRSAALLAGIYPELPKLAFVVAGDFVAESLRLAKGFDKIAWGCYFGKLIKICQGLDNTHAHQASLDMEFLAEMADMPGLAHCLTAQAALEYLLPDRRGCLRRLVALAKKRLMEFSERQITIHLFHTDGRELARA